MDYQEIIDKYYPNDNELKHILLTHSKSVAQKALQIAALHPELNLDKTFLEEAAMLHDIGIFRCDAPGIYCYGDEPYLRHGVIGAGLIRDEGYPKHARVCERHTGTGLPGMHPETMEEKVICYADKFFSKTHLDHERTVEEAYRSLLKFGQETASRLLYWTAIFDNCKL